MKFFNIFGKTPVQKAKETKRRLYGDKLISERGLRNISKANSKPEFKLYHEGSRLGIFYKEKKMDKHDYRASIDPKLDIELARRQQHKRVYTEEGLSLHKGVYARGSDKIITIEANKKIKNQYKPI